MTDFTSGFWGYFIATVAILGVVFCAYLLLSQMKVKLQKGEKAQVTGHKWDGDLEEYNNPLPGWWVGMFVLTLVFAVGYFWLYPGLVVMGNAKGWSQEGQHKEEVAKADAKYQALYDKYAKLDIPAVAQDKEANAMGKRLFMTYCVQCHGADARGAKGFPNLTDGDWLYGGKPENILETLNKGRHGQMPAFGAAFGEEKVRDAANYVLKISGSPAFNDVRAERGAETFKQVCAACHGADGKGNQSIGAPNLTDKTWLYGGSEATIVETITNGRDNVMPAWKEFLGDGKVHLLAAYVYSLRDSNK
ncbi:cytochrome-c oxidase, cbb3-type subunit III [Chitinibacter tainanensis]|uniref:cytochrome-c oxidase, cbb3-type subunit III n=1 Tax=Chitinibacter tainanensis TaxID=230667 RepID=UPI0004286FCA|nr:cytochrome-c oxidase, cbb3-type subunit III [Chitinibacter tainanensis]